MKTSAATVCGILAAILLAGCSRDGASRARTDSASGLEQSASASPDTLLNAVVTTGKLTTSRAITSGWRTFRVSRTDNASHILVAFQVDPALSTAAFIAALDSFPNTPAGAVALGGPEGATTEVLLRLPAGRVIVACVSRAADGHRHAVNGEVAEIDVRPAPVTSIADSAPVDSGVVDVPMSDFAYIGIERIPASTRFLRVRNRGLQDHQLRMVRLKTGKTISDWVKDPDATSDSTGAFGMARLGSPLDAYLPVSLHPGTYVLFCLVADPKTRQPHVELGMMREIFVIP